jgi:hypothetical protein
MRDVQLATAMTNHRQHHRQGEGWLEGAEDPVYNVGQRLSGRTWVRHGWRCGWVATPGDGSGAHVCDEHLARQYCRSVCFSESHRVVLAITVKDRFAGPPWRTPRNSCAIFGFRCAPLRPPSSASISRAATSIRRSDGLIAYNYAEGQLDLFGPLDLIADKMAHAMDEVGGDGFLIHGTGVANASYVDNITEE